MYTLELEWDEDAKSPGWQFWMRGSLHDCLSEFFHLQRSHPSDVKAVRLTITV